MIFKLLTRRERAARNRRKAQALVAEYSHGAADYVSEQIQRTKWQISSHEHWLRVERHVRAILRKH